jgi:hypothetical protein
MHVRPRDDIGDWHLAKVGVRPADHRCLQDAGVLMESALDFSGIDVLPAADDQVTLAVSDAQSAVGDAGEVTGPQPAIGDGARLIGADVRGENQVAVQLKLSQPGLVRIGDPQLNAGNGMTAGVETG